MVSHQKILSCGWCLGFVLLLSACATSEPMAMRLSQVETETGQQVWPGLPEVPRYQLIGELTGEANFVPINGSRGSGLTRALRWLAGIGAEIRDPVVLQRPQGVAVDPGGRVYITDMGRQAVYVFDEIAGELLVWDTLAGEQRFIAPIGVTVMAGGDILVADAELGRVIRLDRSGNLVGTIGDGILQRPTGVAWEPSSGDIYVADTRAHDIKVFDGGGGLVNVIGAPGSEAGRFNAPTHIALAAGKLYVSDTLNARVQVFTTEGEPVRDVGERGLYVGNLTRPKGVAVDGDGNIYVIESYYDYLLIYKETGELLLPIGGTGNGVGQFYLPAGVTVDAGNRVYIADMFNGRVVVLQYLGS